MLPSSHEERTDRPKMFVASQEMIKAAQAVFVSIAYLQMVEPIVVGYQRLILKEAGWKVRPDFASRGFGDDEVVTDPEMAWLLSEANLMQYDQLCQRAQMMSGLAVSKPGNCPLSEAKTALVQTKMDLARAMEPVTGLAADQVSMMESGKFENYIDLSLRLLAPHLPGGTRSGQHALDQVLSDAQPARFADRPH
jgi:hypothetical protein